MHTRTLPPLYNRYGTQVNPSDVRVRVLASPSKRCSPRAQVVLFLDSRPSIRIILFKANMSTDYENQSLIEIYFNTLYM